MDTPAYPHLNRVIAGGVTAEASRKKTQRLSLVTH
jgi:hypothetical protein